MFQDKHAMNVWRILQVIGHTEIKISVFTTRREIQSLTGHVQVIFYLSI